MGETTTDGCGKLSAIGLAFAWLEEKVFDLSRILGRTFAAADTRPAIWRYSGAVAGPLLAAIVTITLFGYGEAPFFPFFGLAVVLAAVYGGTLPGLVAVALTVIFSCVMVPPTGSLRVADATNLLRVGIFGVVGGAFAVIIGALGWLQRKLDLERQRLQVTLSSIGDAVIATDQRSCIIFMNPVAEQVTGWKSEDALGRGLTDVFRIINEETRATVANPVDKVLATGKVVGLANHTLLIRRDGSEIAIDDSAAPIRDGEHIAGVILVFRDVSEARKAQSAILRAEKLASVGRLAATIAHEINNPLESLTNLLYLIRNAEDLNTARMFADTAQNELSRAAHVAQQALTFARQRDKQVSADVAFALNSVIALHENKLRAKDVNISCKVDSAMVKANGNELIQLISNLLGNAIDAVGPGGSIRVRVFPMRCKEAIRITVADTGTGIDRENLKKVFQPFFTTKKDVGTGLGLWVSRQIVERCGGNLRVKSKLGKGTVFMVMLPEAKTSEIAVPAD